MDIDEMTAEQLRVEVARAKGFRMVAESDGHAYLYLPSDSSQGEEELDLYDYYYMFPDWPNDIAAAWELVEEMHPFMIESGWGDPDDWRVKVNTSRGEIACFGETAPIAICRAYLKWKSNA